LSATLAWIIGLLATVAASPSAAQLEPLAPPSPAPALRGLDLAGKARRLRDYRGKTVLVNFWASWCPPCLQEMPALEALSRSRDPDRFAVLAVNVGESPAVIARFTRLAEAGIVMLADRNGDAARRWGVKIYPSSYVVDAQGRVRYEVYGPIEWDGSGVRELLDELDAPSRSGISLGSGT
jgi:thiol-disulfide isomerase/thioredoxin